MKYFEGFGQIRYYIIIIACLFGGFIYLSASGTRLLGDDNTLRDEPRDRTRAHVHGFYHK